ncbi:MAG: tRNA adenosine(34) deaminase TadA [candidate division KSB1 bacterium]|nr:tRNA adenosine(34) deaminase TadA [candidate division KSB1 bacterium]
MAEDERIVHEKWMSAALEEARKAFAKGEVPVGAVVVSDNCIIGRGHNLVETLQDPAAHAEMLAVSSAAAATAGWRLEDAVLYATLEPCMMCAGAVLLARIPLIVYGAADPRYGACGSRLDLVGHNGLDVHAQVISGVLEAECSSLLKDFFKKLRQRDR